jgi:HSP20 family molecular chaperone IbpA
MEDTSGDPFRRIQELLEQMIRDSMEQGNMNPRPMGFTLVIRGSGPFPLGQGGPGGENGGTIEPRVEVHDGGEEVLVLAELPGIPGDQVRLDLGEGILRIAASDGAREFRGEAALPPVDPASMMAGCRNGVLEVRFRRLPGPAGRPGSEGAPDPEGSRERPGG